MLQATNATQESCQQRRQESEEADPWLQDVKVKGLEVFEFEQGWNPKQEYHQGIVVVLPRVRRWE